MFSEAYWVFSVGNLKGIFRAEYPNCWKSHSQCSSGLINSLTYTQVSFWSSTSGSQQIIWQWVQTCSCMPEVFTFALCHAQSQLLVLCLQATE